MADYHTKKISLETQWSMMYICWVW